jgi:hypothetical protein
VTNTFHYIETSADEGVRVHNKDVEGFTEGHSRGQRETSIPPRNSAFWQAWSPSLQMYKPARNGPSFTTKSEFTVLIARNIQHSKCVESLVNSIDERLALQLHRECGRATSYGVQDVYNVCIRTSHPERGRGKKGIVNDVGMLMTTREENVRGKWYCCKSQTTATGPG